MVAFTPEEQLQARPAFDSWGKPGLFRSIVLAQWEKEREIQIDIAALLAAYMQFNARGVVALITFLASEDGADITEIGTGSVTVTSTPTDALTQEAVDALQEVYVGDPKRGITPLAWLTYLSRSLESLDKVQLHAFDVILGTIGLSMARIMSGDYDLVTDEALED